LEANHVRGMREQRRDGSLRAGLGLMAATVLPTGLWALASPRSFYDTFPLPGWRWVSTLGPFNEHLVRDYGAMSLALGALLATAAVHLETRLVRAALVTWLVFAVPHLVFHLGQTEHFSPAQNAAQLVGLGAQVALPVLLLLLTRGRPGR
jgi:hypothetical protein